MQNKMREVLTFAQQRNDGYSHYFEESCVDIAGYKPVQLNGDDKYDAMIRYLSAIDGNRTVLLVNRSSTIFSGPIDPLFDEFESHPGGCDNLIYIASQQAAFFSKYVYDLYGNHRIFPDVMLANAKTFLKIYTFLKEVAAEDEAKTLIDYFNNTKKIRIDLDSMRYFFVFLEGQALLFSNVTFKDDPDMPVGKKRCVYDAGVARFKPCLVYRSPGCYMTGILQSIGFTIQKKNVYPFSAKTKIGSALDYCKSVLGAAFVKSQRFFG